MRRITLGILLLSTGLAFVSCDKTASSPNDENATYAVVNGKEIKAKDVLERIKNDLAELERNTYELKKRATEEFVQKALLEDEAKKQGTTVDKLMTQFDNLRDKEVTKEETAAFLSARNLNESKLSKQERESVPQIIKMQRVYEARQKFVNDLRAKANVQYKIPKPVEKQVDVAVGNIDPQGKKEAKVKIVEFSDFQCPFCARGKARIDEIAAKYKDKVVIYFRNFPLESIHQKAFHAAEAGLCAQDQGKFWDYHNKMFDNQANLEEKDLLKYAKDLKLDEAKFSECLKSGKKAADIRKDMEEGMKVGVNSTPTFFVNGYAVRGAVPLEQFSEIIDEQLAK